jgi:hypothetical protein
MYDHFKTSALGGHIYDFKDLCLLELKGDNLQGLVNDFETTIEGMDDVPKDNVLEWFLFIQLEHSEQFAPTMALHKLQMTQQGKQRDYEGLMKMVKVYLEEQRREKIRKDKDGKLGKKFGGAAPKAGPKAIKGDCKYFLKHGKCNRAGDCPFEHDCDKANERRGRPREKAAGGKGTEREKTPRKQSGADSGSKPRKPQSEMRNKSPSGKPDRKPCTNHLKGTCKLGDKCDYWHTPPCIHYKRGTCDAGKHCIYLHNAEKKGKGKGKGKDGRSSSKGSKGSNGSKGKGKGKYGNKKGGAAEEWTEDQPALTKNQKKKAAKAAKAAAALDP